MKTKITYHHFHAGNDTELDKKTGLPIVRGSAVYATRGRLVDLDTGNVLKEAWAYCSPSDPPSRAKGREIVAGRLTVGEQRRRRRPAALPENVKETFRNGFEKLKKSALAALGV